MIDFTRIHEENKQVSLTGARAIILMSALMEGPKNFEEIIKFFKDCGVSEKYYSVDTIRIDINTLKKAGFVISKATKTNNHKYHLVSQPFVFNPTQAEIDAIKTIYRKIARTASPYLLYLYHNLFKKIAEKAGDEKIKNQLLGISNLKSVKLDMLDELVQNEETHNRVKILYKPNASTEHEYDITIEKIGVRSDKLYVYCFNHTIGERAFLNVSKIKSILGNLFDNDSTLGMDIEVKFKLCNYNEYTLDDNEVIVEENPEYIIVQAKYFNEFIAMQRLLSFSRDCTVIESDEIKEKLLLKLKEMRAMYE
mgnify:CR=1 FL=1